MEKSNSTSGILRTKSDQLVETVMAALKSPAASSEASGGAETSGGGGTLSRKSSKRLAASASPGRSGGGGSTGKNTHIRKSRSGQIKLDVDEVSSGAALSRASSASLGFSFSFTGFVPSDEVADMMPFSDDDMIRKCSIANSCFVDMRIN